MNKFFEQNGAPHCEKCYMKNFSPRCAFCNLIIKDKAITALGQRWHAEHLTCAQCSKPYDGSNFFTKVRWPGGAR